jgi:acrylyl-CoA reductase (NADPH)
MNQSFRALYVTDNPDGTFRREITRKSTSRSPRAGDVLIRVLFSSLNFKDGLSASREPRRHKAKYPHIPGVDAAGVVEESSVPDSSQPGDEVVVHGYELGANHWGGFAGYIQGPGKLDCPESRKGSTLRETMMYGTAGFTSGLGRSPADAQRARAGSGSGARHRRNGWGRDAPRLRCWRSSGFTSSRPREKWMRWNSSPASGRTEVVDRAATKDADRKAAPHRSVGRRSGHRGRRHPRCHASGTPSSSAPWQHAAT